MKHWNEECAVFGIWGDSEAGRMGYLGLYAQQHRGQESAGLVSLNEGQHLAHKGLGLVGKVFTEKVLEKLLGRAAVGHVRYSTTGQNHLPNTQPLTVELSSGPVTLAHNGNIVNSKSLRRDLQSDGAIFQGTNDTEILLHLLARNKKDLDFLPALKKSLSLIRGAYSMVILTGEALYALRDPLGFRPLVLGQRESELTGEKSWVVASESCAFDLIGAEYVREIEPGEILKINSLGIESFRLDHWSDIESPIHKSEEPLFRRSRAQCVFEHVYFSRPDSKVFGQSVYEARKKMGEVLANEFPVDADIVIPVPDSGVPAALGYAKASGIPFEWGIIRNHYIGRTFIQPSQSIRSFGVKIKLNPQSDVLKGRRVVVIDDSLVRGTTSQKIISLIRQAGAKEVHFRIASPPTIGACYYGVDTPRRQQLLASERSVDQIRDFIGADTLAYLSIEGLMTAVNSNSSEYCLACFDGKYPTRIED